jgi:hexosaminidase
MRSFTTIFYFAPLATAIWPLPVIYEHGETVIWIKKNVSIHWYETGQAIADAVPAQVPFVFASNSNTETGTQVNEVKLGRRLIDPAKNHLHGEYEDSEEVTDDHIIEFAIKSAWKTIFEHNLYPWKFHSRNWTEPSPQDVAIQVSRVDIKLLSRSTPHPNGEVDESYTIDLTEEGRATISANSSVGISHGLTTFTQLFYAHSNAEDAYTPFAPLHIFDAPVFQHRGINLDVSRHYFSVSDIKRQIDACAYNKMNRFHLHVTDSQAWPLEIPSLPSLARNGAYRPDLTYTPHDFAEIQRHAALQGVQVITEIDMPGHTSSIYHAFPELIAAFDMQPDWDTYAAEPPSGTLKLNSTAVDDFLETLFDDLLPRVAPYSEYFHTGGDEVNMNAYMLDDTVKSNKFEVLQPLMQRFVEKNHERVRRRGLTPVVWEEMLLEWNLTLGDDVVVQSWRSDEAVKKIVERGHKALVGNYKYWVRTTFHAQYIQMISRHHVLSFSPVRRTKCKAMQHIIST